MKRRRAKGGGRKPSGEFSQLTSSLTIRIPEDMRKQLESEAAANGQSVAQVLLWHLRQSFNRERDKERDPALQGLLFMIAQLAERIAGGQIAANPDYRAYIQREWRTDLFKFRAFKFAVGKLLDALEEPPGEIRPAITEEQAKEADVANVGPEFIKYMVEVYKSPESFGADAYKHLWTQVVMSKYPLTNAELRMIRKHPDLGRVMEREYFGFQRARKALELRPESEVTLEFLSKVMDEDKIAELKRLKKEAEELEARVKKIKDEADG